MVHDPFAGFDFNQYNRSQAQNQQRANPSEKLEWEATPEFTEKVVERYITAQLYEKHRIYQKGWAKDYAKRIMSHIDGAIAQSAPKGDENA